MTFKNENRSESSGILTILAVVGLIVVAPFALGIIALVAKVVLGLTAGLFGAVLGIASAVLGIGLAFFAVVTALGLALLKVLAVPLAVMFLVVYAIDKAR